jgi:hypothetical protein
MPLKRDEREGALSTAVVLLWVIIFVVTTLCIGTANAQTVVSQPTTITLWAGSQDFPRESADIS